MLLANRHPAVPAAEDQASCTPLQPLPLPGTSAGRRAAAKQTQAELHLLALAIPGIAERSRDWQALAVSQARQLVAGVGGKTFHLLSTRRQFQHYGQWYARLCTTPPAWQDKLLAIAQAVVDELPAVHDAEWDYARG